MKRAAIASMPNPPGSCKRFDWGPRPAGIAQKS